MDNPARRLTLAVAGVLLSAGVALCGRAQIDGDYHRDRLDTPETQLVVNPSHPYWTIAESACEAEGVQNIVELMRSSHVEAIWAYVRDPGIPDTCQWMEIGRGKPGSRAEQTTIKVDRQYLAVLMAQHTILHLYHFHPLVYFEQCSGGMRCGDLSVPMTADGVSEEGLLANLRYAMPSPMDIVFMLEVSWEFDQHRHAGGRIRNRVITPYGLVEYALTEAGKKRLADDGMEGHRGRWGFDTYIKARISYRLSEVDAIITRNPHDVIKALQELARGLNNEYLLVTYTPF